jgi:hypothetical protein
MKRLVSILMLMASGCGITHAATTPSSRPTTPTTATSLAPTTMQATTPPTTAAPATSTGFTLPDGTHVTVAQAAEACSLKISVNDVTYPFTDDKGNAYPWSTLGCP